MGNAEGDTVAVAVGSEEGDQDISGQAGGDLGQIEGELDREHQA